jgi:hypothetical protein
LASLLDIRQPISAAGKGEPPLPVTAALERMADKKLRHYLRDVQDHLLLADEEVAAQRDLLGTIWRPTCCSRGGAGRARPAPPERAGNYVPPYAL